MKLKKNDKVKITSGKYRGKEGVIEKALPRDRKVVISGVNIVKKHIKPRGSQKPGGIIDIAKPIDISKVMLVCPNCGETTRVGFEIKGEEKYRICKKCGTVIK